jgi:hypothetical protein
MFVPLRERRPAGKRGMEQVAAHFNYHNYSVHFETGDNEAPPTGYLYFSRVRIRFAKHGEVSACFLFVCIFDRVT